MEKELNQYMGPGKQLGDAASCSTKLDLLPVMASKWLLGFCQSDLCLKMLAGYLWRHVDFIMAFVTSTEKEESQKIPFLLSICDLCYNSRCHGPPQGLDLFCQTYELAENIKSCARYLRSSKRANIILVFITAMRDTSIFDKKRATDLLDVVMEFPDFWLVDARKIQSLLPQVMGLLDYGNTEIKRKVLAFFHSVMGHLKREETSSIAEQLAEKLLPLFGDESSQLRELSICFFREQVQSVMGGGKKRMKSYMCHALLPLFFHLSGQSDSVAKLEQDRSSAEDYMSQSLWYLKDARPACERRL
ncbi:hypothetical protein Q9966_014845 [Columba livia]|nr:hypothetical protein Q9966_014845 [Columba livia]